MTLQYQPPIIASVDEDTFLIQPQEVSLEAMCSGKFVVAIDNRDKDALRLYGVLYSTQDSPTTEATHSGLFDILRKLQKLEYPFPTPIIGGGTIKANHQEKVIALSGSSTQFGACPAEILIGCISSFPGYSKDIRDPSLILPVRNQDAIKEWYYRHGFQVE